jgi:hypothetical protein
MPAPAAGAATRNLSTMVFQRVAEPREGAFTMLIPRGWQMDGGIFRVDPTAQGGSAQSIEAKIQLVVRRDAAGSVMLCRIPDYRYCDTRGMPAAGMFPPGSNYNGMMVMPKPRSAEFLANVVFPRMHPQARNTRVVDQRPCVELAQSYQQRLAAMAVPINMSFDAGLLTVEYDEGGVRFREVMLTLIQDYGQMGAGMWENKETGFFRAPAAEFDQWTPVLSVMLNSIKANPQWLSREIQGQMARAGIALRTQQEVQRIEAEMVAHRQRTNSEINHDMFLNLTGQEEYVNPYTKEVERDTSGWRYRWVSPGGDVAFSNQDGYDPNHDTSINRTDFKATPVRPRFPQ